MNHSIFTQWSLDSNLTKEEYDTTLFKVQTENSSSEVGDYSSFIRQEFGDRSYARNAGIIYGLIFGIVWPYALWILLKLIGFILIVLTFGHSREFVNSTFFKWTENSGRGFYPCIWEKCGGCGCLIAYVVSMALGCFLGYTIANVIIENDIIELQNMNLTLAQLEHKKYVIATTDSVFMILGMVLFGVLLIAFGLCLQICCCPKGYQPQNNSDQESTRQQSETTSEAPLIRGDSIFG